MDLREEDFFAGDFFAADFLETAFLDGTFAPLARASLIPIAIACLRLVTLRPELDLRSPSLYSCITLCTLSLAFLEYLAMMIDVLFFDKYLLPGYHKIKP